MAMKRLPAGLRKQAEAIGKDDAGRAQIIRTVTKQIVVHRASGKSRLKSLTHSGRAATLQHRT